MTVHPQMLDVMSMGQFLTMLSELLDVVASATKSGVLPFDWIRYLITRFEPSDGPQNQMMGSACHPRRLDSSERNSQIHSNLGRGPDEPDNL